MHNLGVEHIIVLGHAHCGGIQALVETGGINNPDSFIDDWMHLVESARVGVERDMPRVSLDDRVRACEQRAILVSLQNLMTFPWVRERVERRAPTLHGWYFDIGQGQLLGYNATANAFEVL